VTSFIPLFVVAQVPEVVQLGAAVGLLATAVPEVVGGRGDGLVLDARAHLPFSATRTTNPLNHAEALWDPTLQAQVVAILSGLRTPGISGRAVTRIDPFPASEALATHTVTAADAVSGQALAQGR
jgi:hypothetical protein